MEKNNDGYRHVLVVFDNGGKYSLSPVLEKLLNL